jgi:hypothetical protein
MLSKINWTTSASHPTKTKSLIDFISTSSAIATKVCTVKNIQHGFTEAGMFDGDNLRFPVYDKILATCRWNPSLAEYENIEKNMPTILHHSCEFGHVSDDIYDKLGIIQDREKMGHEVTRDASIFQKNFQQTSVSLTNIRFVSITKGCPRISGLKVKGRKWQITSIRRKSKHQTISLPFDC